MTARRGRLRWAGWFALFATGCANPLSDYSSGYGLFIDKQWDWLVAASYREFALLETDRVTIVYLASYEIRDRSYRLVRNPTPPRAARQGAQKETSRFYR